jgi:hypothetical protein
MAEVTLPEGKYVIGDIPCLNLKSGAKATEFNTMYGDGIYKDNYGKSYFVDSGSIGCVEKKYCG